MTGAAAQIAQVAGLIVAFFCARPLGRFVGPRLAAHLELPLAFGVIAATILVFVIVLIASRIVIATVLRRLMAGRDPDDRSLDRTLGMVFAAAKVGGIAYVILSGLAFVEEHVVVAGKRLGLSPRDSYAFAAAREYNLFEMTQFGAVDDLVAVARAVQRGDTASLKDNAAYRSLADDPRFKKAMNDPEMRRAIESGDYRALLRNNAVLQLIQDPTLAARLGSAARDAE